MAWQSPSATKSFPVRYAAMAKRPLKVFRTSAGFQDAYVATTSRKAALEAWGARTDLFASGIAEQVTDPKLTKAALSEPGKVIRLAKGTAAQHLAAAGKSKTPTARKAKSDRGAEQETVKPPKPRLKLPKPSREKLTRAEKALERIRSKYADALADIDARIGVLRKERDELRSRRDAEVGRLDDRRTAEEDAYRSALNKWEG